MLGRKRFDEAIENGKRNRDAIQLVRNWCAHAKVVVDARGMLAARTGLPIGHHHIRCDFATDDSTLSCFEVSDAALDFYDRNCVDCAHRQPVRIPNISELVGERDRERAKRSEEAAGRQAEADAALAARDETRRILRERLSPLGQTLIDDIAAFDRDGSDENERRLVESARMAPEHFSDELQNYILEICEKERWLDRPALEILETLGTDQVRLAALASKVLRSGVHQQLAARVLLPIAEHLTEEEARLSTPSATGLAAPDRRDVFDGRKTAAPALLHRLYELHPRAVDSAIETLIETKRMFQTELAAKAVSALIERHKHAADRHARTLISTYVRASLLVQDFEELDRDLYAVRDAVVRAFDAKPAEIDALLQEYVGAIGSTHRKRVYEIYAWALGTGYDEKLDAASDRASIAFRRLLWATTEKFDDGVMQTAVEVFRDRSKKLLPVAILELEAVLGAPFLLMERSRELEKSALDPAHPLAQIQRNTDLSSYRTMMKSLVGLAAEAALEDASLLPRIGEFLESIPEDAEQLRSIAIEKLVRLADDVTGLALYLPHLYRAMVGPSVAERAGAARAMGEMSNKAADNLPELVFESFVPLLFDSYIAVHKSAARSLRTSRLPERLRMQALNGLMGLVRVYRTESGDDSFLTHCVRTLAGSADEFGADSRAVRRWLIDVCLGIDPIFLQSEIRSLRYTLGTEPTFAKIVLLLLPHMVDRFNRSDNAQEMLRALSPAAVLTYASDFEEMGKQLATADPWLTLVIIDALARAGDPDAAKRVTRAGIDAHEDNPRNHGLRLSGETVELAFNLEAAVASGDDDAITAVATRHNEIEQELKARRDEQRKRDSRTRPTFPN